MFTWLACSTARPKCPHQAQRAGSQPPRSTDPQVLIFFAAKAPDLACDQMISCAWHQEGTRLALEEQGPKTRQFMLEFCALDDGQEHIPKMRAPNLIKQVTVKSGAASCCHEEASDTAWMKGLRGFQLI